MMEMLTPLQYNTLKMTIYYVGKLDVLIVDLYIYWYSESDHFNTN